MPRTMTELFNGGLVTARVGALLNSGELQRADDCIYREKDPAVWRAPGRTALTSTAIGTDIRGVGHLSFDGAFVDQFVLLGRKTSGSPTWHSGPDTSYPALHLYGTDFTAISGLSPVEIGGQGQWTGTISSTTLTFANTVASCVTTATATTVTAPASSFTNNKVSVGAIVSGTGIRSGTRVESIDSDTQITLDQTASASGTVTLTFTQYPLLAGAVGAQVIITSAANTVRNITITAVSGQDGTTGHYSIATISVAPSGGDGVYTVALSYGSIYDWQNTGNEILDFVQYGARKYYAWDGIGKLNAIEWQSHATSVDATLGSGLRCRPVGLKPVEVAWGVAQGGVTPSVAVQTGQSTGWNSIKGAGKYWILITEIFSPSGDIATALKDPVLRAQVIESAYLGTDGTSTADVGSQSGVGLPVSATITTVASDNILITFPAVTNNGVNGYIATHWGIYIYGPSQDVPSLASMRRCATVPITQYTAGQTYPLTDSVLTQTKYPTAVRAVGSRPQFGHADFMTGAPDDRDGYTKVGGSGKHIPDTASQGLTTYGFVTSGNYASKTPIGIEVQVRGKCNPSGDTTHTARYWFRAMTTGAAKATQVFYGEFGGEDNHTNYHGGPMDTLGVAWTNGDTALVEVEIGIQNRGHKDELDIDTVGIKFYYTTNNVDFFGPAYRVVTYRDQVGLTVSDPARLPPPIMTTGDFFQGCFVGNNRAQENQVKYSLPGDPEAWPKPYELTFNTRKRDKVTFIRAMNGVLIVGMENSVKRVNYLPRETDTDMTSGLAHEDIVTDHGIPGPFCAVKFDMPGKGIMLAYASTDGMFLTNGQWSIPMNMDLDWANTVKLSALSTAVLRVYPSQKLLALYYCPAGATHSRNTRVMYFCYQADKMKGEFGLPAIGPCVVSARSACEAFLNGVSYLFTGHETDGTVYVEDSGVSIPSGYQVRLDDDSDDGDGKETADEDVQIIPFIRTRKFYPITLDRDGYGEKVYLLFSAYGSNSISLNGTTVVNDTTVTVETTVMLTAGTRVLGSGIDPGSIVKRIINGTTFELSRAANASGTALLVFDTGTISITVRGSNLGEAVRGLSTDYVSTLVGDLVSVARSHIRRGFELQIEKVPLTFDSNGDTATWADLDTNMRLHTLTYVVTEGGLPDSSRNAN